MQPDAALAGFEVEFEPLAIPFVGEAVAPPGLLDQRVRALEGKFSWKLLPGVVSEGAVPAQGLTELQG